MRDFLNESLAQFFSFLFLAEQTLFILNGRVINYSSSIHTGSWQVFRFSDRHVGQNVSRCAKTLLHPEHCQVTLPSICSWTVQYPRRTALPASSLDTTLYAFETGCVSISLMSCRLPSCAFSLSRSALSVTTTAWPLVVRTLLTEISIGIRVSMPSNS